jgi:DNA-binding NtrC family response regulator
MPQKATILVIDDELNLRRTLAFILQRAGYLVVTAADGLDALRCLVTGSFDLVFIDLRLPDVEGIRLADEIHKIYPQIPVIILTGHPTLETKTEATKQAIAAYLAKPIDPTQILAKVEEVLEKNNGISRGRKQ